MIRHKRKIINKILSPKILLTSTGMIFGLLSQISAGSIHVVNKQIQNNEKRLKDIQTQIKSLESEKNELKKNEQKLIETLSTIETDIEKSNQTISRMRTKIRSTEKSIYQLNKEINNLSNHGSELKESILNDLQTYHTVLSYPQRLSAKLIDKVALESQVANKFNSMNQTETKKELAIRNEKKLKQEKETLLVFKTRLSEELKTQKSAMDRKKSLYETTQGRRLIAEMEVTRLRETSTDLEKLVLRLRREKAKDLASRKENEYLKKSFQRKRGMFSWPTDGIVVSKFGRQKHPDLDITIINSGVKIKTNPKNPVTSVNKGTVIYASDFRSYGQTVIVDHGGDSYTVYGLLGNILVKEGERVKTGDTLGESSPDPESLVYFEVRNQGKSENPLNWLR